jgi:Ni,Fe-hydrogenase III small subunit/ferredoxin
MPWIPRGLRHGVVTSGYPKRPDGYGPGFFGHVEVAPVRADGPEMPVRARVPQAHAGADGPEALAVAVAECPTGAIAADGDVVRLDRGRCILCGRCVALAPSTFRADPGFETACHTRRALVVPASEEDDAAAAEARARLARRVRGLRRSVHVRHVDAGSDGAEEWEVAALTNPVYDIQRLGVFFTASPKHADVLLVTGVGTAGMEDSLRQTYDLMPEPKVVVAAGVDAASGGMVGVGYAARGGIAGLVPVDVYVPGSPPSPFGILHGILVAVGILGSRRHVGAEGPDHPAGASDHPPGAR